MGLRMEGEIPLTGYRERLGRLDDGQLKREWDAVIAADEWEQLKAVKHEMALRFMGRSESQKGQQDVRAYFSGTSF